MRRLAPLQIKLLRDLRRLWAQALAIALVMAAGVATLVLGVGAVASLERTRDAYYEANRFADVFASVTRAPRTLLPRIEAIDGVLDAEGRTVKLALLDMPGMSEPGSVLLVSAPLCPSCGQPASQALAGPEHGYECRNEACPEFGQPLRAEEPESVEPNPGRDAGLIP